MEDQHIYTHNDSDGPRVSVKVEKNSKGFNYEAHVQGCKTVEEAIDLLNLAVVKLTESYSPPAA
jgi:hypothetical protein